MCQQPVLGPLPTRKAGTPIATNANVVQCWKARNASTVMTIYTFRRVKCFVVHKIIAFVTYTINSDKTRNVNQASISTRRPVFVRPRQHCVKDLLKKTSYQTLAPETLLVLLLLITSSLHLPVKIYLVLISYLLILLVWCICVSPKLINFYVFNFFSLGSIWTSWNYDSPSVIYEGPWRVALVDVEGALKRCRCTYYSITYIPPEF